MWGFEEPPVPEEEPPGEKVIGGYGHLAYGRHKFGAQDSKDFQYPTPQSLGPRFNGSKPQAGAYAVPRTQWITYELYYFSSSLGIDLNLFPSALPVEISEDGGTTWASAATSPYTLTARFKDGQTLWIKIVKDSMWADDSQIIIRTTMPDEFGQVITDELPVRWE